MDYLNKCNPKSSNDMDFSYQMYTNEFYHMDVLGSYKSPSSIHFRATRDILRDEFMKHLYKSKDSSNVIYILGIQVTLVCVC